MSQFQFTQRCRARSELRIKDAIEFMLCMQQAFHVPGWVDAEDQPVALSLDAVESTLRSLVSEPDLERFGVTWVVKSTGDDAPIVLAMAMGGDEWSPNFFNTDFTRTDTLPDLLCFRQSIEMIRPFEAFILDEKNERELRQQQPRKPRSDRPRILRWFHYMDAELVKLVGGTPHCLQTPAFKVESFCDGVLFQLTEVAFDADNPQHKEIQLQAMHHLDME